MVQKGATITVENLLNALSTFLDSKGGIKSVDDCTKFYNCMKQLGKNMMNTCTYLNVIISTESEEILTRLLLAGAWDLLYEWLAEYKEADEVPVLTLLLTAFHRLPVTMELLKATKSAKVIKSLVKHSNEELKSLASQIVDKWMSLIKSNASSDSRNGSSHSKDKKKKKMKSEKATAGSSLVIPSPSHDSENTMDSIDQDVPSPPPAPIFKESAAKNAASGETAKKHNYKERSAGVEAGLIKPRPRGSKPKTGSAAATSKPDEVLSSKRTNSDVKNDDSSETKKPKIDADDAKRLASRSQAAHVVQDSDGFMAALMQPARTVTKKKRPAPTPTSTAAKTPLSPTVKEPTTPTSPTSPMISTNAPPSFYKDTLEGPSGASPPRPSSADRLSPVEQQSNSSDSQSMSAEGQVKKSNKKSVRWRDEKELREFFYFELLEDERVNVNRLRDQGGFDELKKREMMSDRQVLKGVHLDQGASNGASDAQTASTTVSEKFPWKKPEVLDLPESKFIPGERSNEKDVQTKRESNVLAAIYFSKEMMPESATEPDREEDMLPTTAEPTKIIPLVVNVAPVQHYEADPTQSPAQVPEAIESNVGGVTSIADLIEGVSEDLLHQLANGEAGQQLIDALANTDTDYLNQIIQTNGGNPDSLAAFSDNQSIMQDGPEGHFPDQFDRQAQYNNGSHRGRGGFHPYNGPRGNRGFNRGFRGGFRGGRGGRGRSDDCYHFMKLGRCDFGNNCKFAHNAPAR